MEDRVALALIMLPTGKAGSLLDVTRRQRASAEHMLALAQKARKNGQITAAERLSAKAAEYLDAVNLLEFGSLSTS